MWSNERGREMCETQKLSWDVNITANFTFQNRQRSSSSVKKDHLNCCEKRRVGFHFSSKLWNKRFLQKKPLSWLRCETAGNKEPEASFFFRKSWLDKENCNSCKKTRKEEKRTKNVQQRGNMKRSDDMARGKKYSPKLPSLRICMLQEPWKRTARFIKMKSLIKSHS